MASKAPFGTDLQAKFDVQLVAGKIIQKPVQTTRFRSKDATITGAINAHKKLKENQGAVSMTREREGVFRPRSKRARSIDIMPIVEEDNIEPTEESSRMKVPHRSTCSQPPLATQSKLPAIAVPSSSEHTALNEEQENNICQLIESIFKPIVNKIGAIDSIKTSCTHADNTGLGLLDFNALLDIFSSHGAKMTKSHLVKLCELSPWLVGDQHILYEKLCSLTKQVLSNTFPNKDITSEHPVTPHGSTIGCDSPDSIEDLQLNYSLPILVDRTNALPFRKPRLKTNRVLTTHPLSKAVTMKSINKLPPIPCTAPTGEEGNSLTKQENLSVKPTTFNRAEGVEKMVNALKSCTDSKGLLETEHAQRVLQNYSLIYNLGLPLQDIKDYVKLNYTTKASDLKLYICTGSFLKHLNSYLHYVH